MTAQHTHRKETERRGSVLVITIVITVILMTIGITLTSILEKDVFRQVYGRQSQIAMNIANSALECTLFNDFQRHVFEALVTRRYDAVDCGELYQVRKGTDWSVRYSPSSDESKDSPAGTGTYQFVVIDSDREDVRRVSRVPCAHITIKRECIEGVNTGTNTCNKGLVEASIEVRGYNACSSGESESSRGLVRRFKVYY